jgi:hypothetical protein
MAAGFNGTQQILDIGAGATINVLATGPVRRIRIDESNVKADGSANAKQGIAYLIPNDGTASGFTTLFEPDLGESVVLGDIPGDHGPLGSCLGNGPGFIVGIGATPATILAKVKSATATGTSIVVRQDY